MLDWLMKEMGYGGREPVTRLVEFSLLVLQSIGDVERSPRRFVLIRNTLTRLHIQALQRRLSKMAALQQTLRDEAVLPGHEPHPDSPEDAYSICTCAFFTEFLRHKLGLASTRL